MRKLLDKRIAEIEVAVARATGDARAAAARRFLDEFSTAELRKLERFASRLPANHLISPAICKSVAKGSDDE